MDGPYEDEVPLNLRMLRLRYSSGLQLMCCLCHFQSPPIHLWSRDHGSRDILSESITSTLDTVLPRGTFIWCMVAATATVVRLARIIDASGNYALDPSFELKEKNIDCTTHFRLNEKPTTGQHEWQATGSHFRSNEKKNDRKSRKTIESLCRLPDAGYRLASSIK